MDPVKRRRYADQFTIFMIGFLLCLLVLFKLQDNFEKMVFDNITNTVFDKRLPRNEDSIIIDALHITHQLLSDRSVIFGGIGPLNSGIYEGSLTNDLLIAGGACGSYACVLANLLATMGYDTRIAQMKVKENYGGHIITEVKTQKGWVVLDASFNLYFTTPSGKLASFVDVSADWDYYKRQVPHDYNNDYRYAGVRYANWGKIPILLPIVKEILTLFNGEQKMRTFSIRPLFLRRYKVYSILLIPFILLLAGHFVKKNKSMLKPTATMNLLPGTGLNKLFRKLPIYSRSKKAYYLSFMDELDLRRLLDCRNSNYFNTQTTSIEISFLNLPFNSIFPKLRTKLGLPRFHIRNQHRYIRHDIYFYKIHLYDKKAIVQFHYSEKKYFLCNITFVGMPQEQKRDILATIGAKYSIQAEKDNANISVDQKKNLLMIDNSVNLNLCYMNNNTEIIRVLLDSSATRLDAMENYQLFIHDLQEIL